VVADNSTIQVFKVSEHTRIHNIKLEEPIRHARIDFKLNKLMVSTASKIHFIEGEQITDSMNPPIIDFDYVFPLYDMYFVASKSGVLYWCSNLRFDNMGECSLFDKQPFHLLCKSGNLIAFSSFNDIMSLKVRRDSERQRQRFVDDVVLIEREEVTSLFEKVREIESRFDLMTSNSSIKLEEEKQNYERAIERLRQKYMDEISFANRKYQELATSKSTQEKQSENMFLILEKGQNKSINEVERMYERKCAI
jgi:hypothetical protein